MDVITIANAKGGTGKTTAAIHLGVAAHLAGLRPIVIDADNQGSAIRWEAKAKAAGEPLPFPVASLAILNLGLKLDEIRGDRLAIIDCGPGNAGIMTGAIDVADVVVSPANASEDDCDQAEVVMAQCRAADIPCAVLLSRIRSSESLPDWHRSDLTAKGFDVFATVIPELVRIRAFGAGVTDPAPFDQLLTEIHQLAAGSFHTRGVA